MRGCPMRGVPHEVVPPMNGSIQYLKFDTVSEGSYTPGAARSCVGNSVLFFVTLFQNYNIYDLDSSTKHSTNSSSSII